VFDIMRAWQTAIAISLAAMGGLARLLNAKDKTVLKMSRILSELFISGFAGAMVLLLALSLNLESDWIGLVCGVAGWIGPRSLDLISEQASRKLGFDLEQTKTQPINQGSEPNEDHKK